MAEVVVSRALEASQPVVARHLGPRSLVEMEGTFDVEDVVETEDGWRVTASATGMSVEFAVWTFDDGDTEGYAYEQVDDRGPFESMETHVSLDPEPDGTTVRMTSTVDLGLPLAAVTDRLAGWKRRGELDRALDALATEVE